MKKSFKVLMGSLALAALLSSSSIKPKTPFSGTGVYLVQDGEEVELSGASKPQEYQMPLEPFQLRFYNKAYNRDKPYTLDVVAFSSREMLGTITEGHKVDFNSPLGAGRGFAAERGIGYTHLIIDDEAHHTVYYQNEEDKRAQLLEKKGKWLKLQMEVQGYGQKRNGTYQETDFNEMEPKELYLAIFVDRNLNNAVEVFELSRVVLKFE